MKVSLTEDPIPFPLFNERFFNEYSKNEQLIGHLNQEMLHLNHKCQYKWLNQQKQVWEQENPIKLLVITWNMHGMIPGYSLKRLFTIDAVQHDLIVIGTQECQRSIAASLLCESKDSWETKLREELGKTYKKVHSTSLNAMHLIVFAHVALIPRINNAKSHTLSQGFMNIVGNKGGIGLSVKVNEKIFLFINSHLESGQNAEPKRQTQFSQLESHFQGQVFQSHKNVPYDYVIWTGDFNSRINDTITTNTIKSHSDFFSWLGRDQMYQSRINKLDYQSEFKEGMIFFPPTYKLLENMNQWAVGNDFRIPGWCDRILFKENRLMSSKKSATSSNLDDLSWTIQLQNYDANFDVLGSDHRPVFAQFTVSF